jgi:ribosomal protein L11 methyltransferase
MTWKVSLPCTREEGERLSGSAEAFAGFLPTPALVATEEAPDRWRLEAFFEARPGRQMLDAVLELVPSAAGTRLKPEQLPDEDWVTLSQQGLEPIRAGRFFVHTPAHRGAVPAGAVALEIDAGRAFGTGHHETTAGCLEALDALKRQGFAARNLIDVGTGTGLLAFAAMRLWPTAWAAASDVDPVAIEVTRENAGVNAVAVGSAPGRVALAVAPGLDHYELRRRAPFDLVIANILAGPLIALAPTLAGALLPGGRIILAGLLSGQAERVAAAYKRQGLRPLFTVAQGDWPTLVMRRPRA